MLLFLLACAGPSSPDAPTPATSTDKPQAVVVASEGLEADLEHTLAFHDTRPPYEQVHAIGTKLPQGVGSLSAKSCGACHIEIYNEWAESTHAHAWVDPQYQAEIAKSDNRWLCLHCHTPLLVQQDRWAIGLTDGDVEAPVLVDNASFDPELREEGITCAACHVRDGVIVGPGLEDSRPPHAVRAEAVFAGQDVCLRCHQAVATYPGKTFTCTFKTGEEWVAGPYDDEGKGCKDCHMPQVERAVAVGGPIRKVRTHGWRGAGIAKVAGVQPPVSTNPPGLELTAQWGADGLSVTMRNERAGHRLPTGDPERWVQVDVHFEDDTGAAIGAPWSHHMGQTWEWWPTPKQLSDNRLQPREERTELVPIPIGATRAIAQASNHRMTTETAAFHELDGYPLSVATHRLVITPKGSQGGLLEE